MAILGGLGSDAAKTLEKTASESLKEVERGVIPAAQAAADALVIQASGAVTVLDNAYDGVESVTGTVTCSAPLAAYSCGGEAGNYGDVITSVKLANALWLQDIVPAARAPIFSGNLRLSGGARVTGP